MSGRPDVETRLDWLVAEVRKSRKAQHLLPDLIRRVCRRELASEATDREIVKRVKRQLHQVGGAYFPSPPRYARWLKDLGSASAGAAQQAVLHRIFRHHSSMAERAADLDRYYRGLFAELEGAEVVLDLACGLNPLGQPWMPISPERYLCCDIYADMLGFVQGAAELIGHPVEAFLHDLLMPPPEHGADVVLLLKTLPCLEQIDSEAGARLLGSLTAPHIIVTYPLRSLGGRDKGMKTGYGERFHRLAEPLGRRITELDIPYELGFRLSR